MNPRLPYFVALLFSGHVTAQRAKPLSIGSRIEMFVDGWLVDSGRSQGVEHRLNAPVRREVVLTMDQPWEGASSAYFTALQDGPLIRLYYRGYVANGGDSSDQQVTCYAESSDGILFTRPNLGLVEFNGSRANNIVYRGVQAHNFAPFLDRNPMARPEEKYKAIGGVQSRLFAFSSSDGLHWKKMQDEPVMTKGAFDSLNVAFWDEQTKQYRCYSRYWTSGEYSGFRAIQSSTSEDFLHWGEPVSNRHRAADGTEPSPEHFYTNATVPCPGAPHHYLSFPMRFLPERKKESPIKDAGVSDAVFLTSRDGITWDRTFMDAWIRPGLDPRNWTHRNNMPARGVVETGADEFSMYVSEHYGWPDSRLRRVSLRRHGFASMHASPRGGEFTTKSLTFSGKALHLNYATSAAGSIQVEIQDEDGKALPGYSLDEMDQLFGDELSGMAKWKRGGDLSPIAGKSIRLRFVMKDADLYAIQFTE